MIDANSTNTDALLFSSAAEDEAGWPPQKTILGKTWLEHQIELVKRANVARIFVLAPRLDAQTAGVVERERSRGTTIIVVRDGSDLAARLPPTQTLLVIDPRTLASPHVVRELVSKGLPDGREALLLRNGPASAASTGNDEAPSGLALYDVEALAMTLPEIQDWDLYAALPFAFSAPLIRSPNRDGTILQVDASIDDGGDSIRRALIDWQVPTYTPRLTSSLAAALVSRGGRATPVRFAGFAAALGASLAYYLNATLVGGGLALFSLCLFPVAKLMSDLAGERPSRPTRVSGAIFEPFWYIAAAIGAGVPLLGAATALITAAAMAEVRLANAKPQVSRLFEPATRVAVFSVVSITASSTGVGLAALSVVAASLVLKRQWDRHRAHRS
ncbi:MAG: hypothetical protein WA906_09005 [Pacificimonas sp.]